MKKMIFSLVAVAMVAVAGVNVYKVSVSEVEMSDLQKENVEALASGEMNPWYLWFSQGLTADEREVVTPCSVSGGQSSSSNVNGYYQGDNYGVSGFYQQSSNRDYSGETVLIKCAFGSSNCSRVDC
jgi:hypothetical protein